MKNYIVNLPIVGYARVEVKAENEDEAEEKALMMDIFDKLEMNENVLDSDLYTLRQIVQGNCFRGDVNSIEVELDE